jgi:hypothetical protein
MNRLKARATPFLVRPRQCLGLGTAALAVALMAPATAFASAQVSGSQQAVSVDARNSSVKEVLSALSQKFKLQFQATANLDRPVSGTYQGSLQHVVARLLEGYNFVIRTNDGALEITVLGTQNGTTVAGAQSTPVVVSATAAPAQTPATFAQVQKPQEAQKPQNIAAPQVAAGGTPALAAKKATSAAPVKPSSPDAAPVPVVLKVAEGPMPVPGPSTAAGPVPKPGTASMPMPTKSGAMPSIMPTPTANANPPTLPMPTSSRPFPGIKPSTNAAPGNSAETGGSPTASAPPPSKP